MKMVNLWYSVQTKFKDFHGCMNTTYRPPEHKRKMPTTQPWHIQFQLQLMQLTYPSHYTKTLHSEVESDAAILVRYLQKHSCPMPRTHEACGGKAPRTAALSTKCRRAVIFMGHTDGLDMTAKRKIPVPRWGSNCSYPVSSQLKLLQNCFPLLVPHWQFPLFLLMQFIVPYAALHITVRAMQTHTIIWLREQ